MKKATRSRVLGAIGIVWGGAMLARGLWSGMTLPDSAASFGGGQIAGLVFGAGLLGAGLWATLKKNTDEP